MSDRYESESEEPEEQSVNARGRGLIDLFDSDFPFGGFFGRYDRGPREPIHALMRTDVYEDGDNYVMQVELPGVDKGNISINLKDGYLSIQVNRGAEESRDRKGYVVKERFTGICKRSFYVGDYLRKEDVHAHLDNGILELTFPRAEKKRSEEQSSVVID